jgi:hypothetical protein
VRLEHRDGYWLLIGIAAPGAAATTVGPLIFIRSWAIDDELIMRHELEHVRQWREQGVARFLVRYVGSYLGWRVRSYPHWAAYRRIPFEVEAEWRARRALIEAHRQ